MRSAILFLLIVALTSETKGACRCVISPLHINVDGSAFCFARRYETGDCEPGKCLNPTNVVDYRLAGTWENYPEYCPVNCRVYGRSLAVAPESDGGCDGGAAPSEAGDEPTKPKDPDGMPVNEDFNPVDAGRVPRDSKAELIGYFTLGLASKVATNIDSDSCVKVGQDVDVKVFRLRIPKVPEEQLVAYEVKPQAESAKRIEGANITNVRYEPMIGDRVLTLQVNLKDDAQFQGKTVHLLRGPK